MTAPSRPSYRGLTALDGAIALIAVLLIVQMWLLTATLGALLFGACFSLYLFIERVDRARSPHPDGGSTRNEHRV